jgi:glycosyltransferase involved in cell wall biosynthesis
VAYNALDMFLMTSQSETYGMVTVEAICSGVPVIGSRDGGTVDLIDEGKTGLFFTPMNDEELSDKIIFFLSHPERMKAMAEWGRRRGLTVFSHARMCEGYEAVFASLMA